MRKLDCVTERVNLMVSGKGNPVGLFGRAKNRLLALVCCRRGNITMMLALSMPALLGAVGLTSDFAIQSMKFSSLQSAADAAALSAAKEMSVSSSTDANVISAAKNYVIEELRGKEDSATTDVLIDRNAGSVTVKVTEVWAPLFAHYLQADVTPIIATSTAKLAGSTNICVLALTPAGKGGIILTNNSTVEAGGCGLYSNSKDAAGIYAGDSSKIDSPLVCSVGGVVNKGGISTSAILTDCPVTPDPLAARPAPSFGTSCDFTSKKVASGTATLSPGVYCGGLDISGTAVVDLQPGTYVIKNGLLRVRQSATLRGKNVGFYMTGFLSFIFFTDDASIDLSGAESGDMAGLLFFEDRNASTLNIHDISAAHADNLTGTIYLPKGNLFVHPAAAIGAKSAYTAIIANRLIVDQGPSLTLNTNYGATSVPVPAGIKATATVVLSN
jgi:Flp pilus assembly protein TadG